MSSLLKSFETRKRRVFYLGYMSELDLKVTIRAGRNVVVATATHLNDGLGINTWYHFCDIESPTDPLMIMGDDVNTVLSELGDELYPGVEPLFRQRVDDKSFRRSQFYTDLYIAFICGSWYPHGPNWARMWEHDVGKRMTERFK